MKFCDMQNSPELPLFFRDGGNINPPGCATIETEDRCRNGYKNIDELFQDIGAHGRFQWFLFGTLFLIHSPGDIIYVAN